MIGFLYISLFISGFHKHFYLSNHRTICSSHKAVAYLCSPAGSIFQLGIWDNVFHSSHLELLPGRLQNRCKNRIKNHAEQTPAGVWACFFTGCRYPRLPALNFPLHCSRTLLWECFWEIWSLFHKEMTDSALEFPDFPCPSIYQYKPSHISAGAGLTCRHSSIPFPFVE